MLVVNLYAGPGSGKTTLAHAVTGRLKMMGTPLVVEYVGEYAKRLVFEDRRAAMANQILILGRQFQELGNLWGKADIVITDGPMLHGLIYGEKLAYTEPFFDLAVWCDRQFQTMNVFVERLETLPFETVGRLQDLEESRALDRQILDMLHATGTPLAFSGPPDEQSTQSIAVQALEAARRVKSLPKPPSWFEIQAPKEYRSASRHAA